MNDQIALKTELMRMQKKIDEKMIEIEKYKK